MVRVTHPFPPLPSRWFLGSEWYIYDVGGSRGARHQWVSYFDDGLSIHPAFDACLIPISSPSDHIPRPACVQSNA